MKKYSLVVVFVFSCAAVFAQLSGGIRLGMNIANQKAVIDGDSDTGDSKVGFLGGFYLTANVSEKFAIQPELVFSGMGSKDKEFDLQLPFNYLSIPVMLRYNITENFNLHAGPQLGFLLSAKVTDGDNSIDIKDSFKGSDFGAAFGLGVDFEKFNAGARYYLGLSNIADDTSDGDSFKNNALQIFLGYRLFGGE
jgi:Outer membrane protein beta-barrel domain